MSLDFRTEQAIAITEVPDHIPKRNGKKVHYSTVFRWTTKGARGRILDSTLIGGIRYTTLEALRRFLDSDPRVNDDVRRQSAIDEALRKAGL